MEVGVTEPLWRVCREKKEKLRLRNEDIAAQEHISENAVAQFLRGETKNVSLYVGAAICRALHVSLDQYLEIVPDGVPVSKSDTDEAEAKVLTAEKDGLSALVAQQKRSLHMHRLVTMFLLGIVALAVIALLIDVLDPSVGWIRA